MAKITELTELNATPAGGDKVPIVDVDDTTQSADGTTKFVTFTNLSSGIGVTDHGALTGLADDDHTQYVLADGSRDITAGQMVDGSVDEIQLRVQGHSTQTANIITVETSAGTVVLSINNAGNIDVTSLTIAGDASAGFSRPSAGRVNATGAFGTGGIFYVENNQAMRRLSDVLSLGAGFGQIGINKTSSLVGDLHVNQNSSTGATAPLALEQTDVSEEAIRFIGSAASGILTQTIVNAADVTTPTVAGYVKVYVQDDGNQITDQAYYLPLYTLA